MLLSAFALASSALENKDEKKIKTERDKHSPHKDNRTSINSKPVHEISGNGTLWNIWSLLFLALLFWLSQQLLLTVFPNLLLKLLSQPQLKPLKHPHYSIYPSKARCISDYALGHI